MRLAEEPLTKVTLNLFTSDIEFLKKLNLSGEWTVEARHAVRAYVRNIRSKENSLRASPLMEDKNG